MSSVIAFETTQYVVECTNELTHFGRLELLKNHPLNPEVKVALVLRVMNAYRRAEGTLYDVSFKHFEVNPALSFTTPMWMVIPLKVYGLDQEQLEFIIHHYLYVEEGHLRPEAWELTHNAWGYSSDRAMMKLWDMVREVHHHSTDYPHHMSFNMTSLTGNAIVNLVIDSPTGRKMHATVNVEVNELTGSFPLAGPQRSFKIASGELGSFNDLFDGPILLDIDRIY